MNHRDTEYVFYNDNFRKVHSVANNRPILEGSSATHNFSPFVYKNKLYALGGQDSWRHNQAIRDMNIGQFREYYYKRYGRKFTKGINHFNESIRILNCQPSRKHSDGVYLFQSKTGYEWSWSKKPVITVESEGFQSCVSWKSSDFDGQISVAVVDRNVFAYMRHNPAPSERSVQLGVSDDLHNWIFYPVETPVPSSYCMVVDKTCQYALVPAVEGEKSNLYLLKSIDFCTWNIVKVLRSEDAHPNADGELKNTTMPCNGFTVEDGVLHFWLHHGYMGIGPQEVCLKEYYHEL
jgi:hypothetical protein